VLSVTVFTEVLDVHEISGLVTAMSSHGDRIVFPLVLQTVLFALARLGGVWPSKTPVRQQSLSDVFNCPPEIPVTFPYDGDPFFAVSFLDPLSGTCDDGGLSFPLFGSSKYESQLNGDLGLRCFLEG